LFGTTLESFHRISQGFDQPTTLDSSSLFSSDFKFLYGEPRRLFVCKLMQSNFASLFGFRQTATVLHVRGAVWAAVKFIA
jgi:hypothetical protein